MNFRLELAIWFSEWSWLLWFGLGLAAASLSVWWLFFGGLLLIGKFVSDRIILTFGDTAFNE